MSQNIYAKLGVKPIINAAGNQTLWGGSTPSPVVKEAMESAESQWVEMQELLDRSGERIAELLGTESAYVTCGCYTALVLSAAACMTGTDAEKQAQLPNTAGMKNEILLHEVQRYGFDRAYTIAGGKLVFFGDANGATAEQLESAIGPQTVAVAYFIKQEGHSGELSLEESVRIAHAKDIPVIVDAASRIYPLDYFRQTAQSGDLVCFGGKYMGSTQSTGFVCGRKDLIDAVSALGFASDKPFGRAMKLDRQCIVGVLAGVEDWFAMDHGARFAEYDRRFKMIAMALEGAPNIREVKVVETRRHPTVCMHVIFDREALNKDATQVAAELYAGDPGIRILPLGEHGLNISVHTLNDGEDRQLAEGLRRVLSMS